MALRILWDKYETALLIDLYLRIKNGIVDSASGINELSKQLRIRATDAGIDIDEVYRNVNGITRQLGNIEQLMSKRQVIKKHNTKMFVDMVDVYFNNKEEFDLILSEAKGVQQVESKQEMFFNWLSKREPAFRMSDYFFAVKDLESFAKQKNISKRRLFEIIDSDVTGIIVSTLESDRYFRSSQRARIQNMVKLAKYYDEYIKSKDAKLPTDPQNMKRDLDENKEKALEQRLPQKQIKSENYSRISPEVISENVDAVEEETRIISSQSSNTKYDVSSEVL